MLTKTVKPYRIKAKRYLPFLSALRMRQAGSLLLSCLILLIIPACGGGGGGEDIGSRKNDIQAVGLSLNWAFSTGNSIYSSPALAQDGTIYIGSDDDFLYALYPSGSLKWRFQTGGDVFSSPAIGDDGTIYVGSNDNYLYAINPDGTEKWSYLTGDTILSTPAIDKNGIVYTGSNDGQLYALSSEGEIQWITYLGGWVSPPAIGPDNTIYVGAGDINWSSLDQSTGELHALNPVNGGIKWQTEINVFSRPAFGSDGTVYVGSTNKNMYALDPDNGEELWRYSTGGPILSSPKVVKGVTDTIIIGSDDQKVYAFTSSGTLTWIAQLKAKIRSSAQTGPDGNVYIGSHDKCLHTFSVEDGAHKGYYPTGAPITTIPAVGKDGTIYFGSQDSKIYALRNN